MSIEEGSYKEVQLGPKSIDIPDSWILVNIEKISNKVTDGTHSTPTYTENGIPFLSTQNLKPFKDNFDFTEYSKFITREEHNKLTKRCNPERGDILLSKCGTIGRTQKIRASFDFSIFVGLALIKPDKRKASSNYLEQFFNHSTIKSILNIKAPGSTRKTLTVNTIKNQEVILPPLTEQKKIAKVLSTVDNAIQKTEEIIERSKELNKGLMQDLLTKGIGYEEFKEVQLGPRKLKIPHNWKKTKIGELAQYLNGYGFSSSDWSNEGLPIIRIQNLTKSAGKETNYYNGELKDRYIVQNGDLLVSWSATLGIFKWQGQKAALNQHIFKVNPEETIDEDFLYFLLDHNLGVLKRKIHGTTMKHITKSTFENTFVSLPPLPEQKKIAEVLSTVDQKIQKEKDYKEKLEKLKKGLMQDLLTGKVRVLPLLSEEEKEVLEKANVTG